MQMVARSKNLLSAFMNYVALSFLIEIDNLFMASRIIRNLVQALPTSVTMTLVLDRDHTSKRNWTWGMAIASNFIALFSIVFVFMCEAGVPEGRSPLQNSNYFE